MNKPPPIMGLEERKRLGETAQAIIDRNPGDWLLATGVLSLIAELEIKEALIERLRPVRETRCSAQAIQSSGIYRCLFDAKTRHTEHQYNYFRALTPEEKQQYYPEDEE